MKKLSFRSLLATLTIITSLSLYAEESGSLLLLLKPDSPKVTIPSEITVTLRNTAKPGMQQAAGQVVKVENLTARMTNIAPASYNINVKSKNVAEFSGKVTVQKNSQAELDIRLQRIFSITGKILDKNSKPIEKAQLIARKDVKVSDVDRFTFFSGSKHAVTDAKGSFKLEGLVAGPYNLRISHSDMIMQSESISVKPDNNTPKIFTMGSGLRIGGKVVESDNSPAQGFKVLISGPISGRRTGGMNKTTMTGPDGSFSQSGLTMGKYNITVQNALSKQQEAMVRGIFAGSSDIQIRLRKKCIVHGTVIDSEGKPVKAADISFRKIVFSKKAPSSPTSKKMTSTDAEGKFLLHLSFGEKYEIKANHHPLLPAIKTLALPGNSSSKIAPITIVMSRGEAIRGTVVSAKDGKPMKGISVRLSPTAGLGLMLKEELQEDSTPTGTDGKFAIEGLRPGVSKLVITPANKPRWILATKQVLVKRGTTPDISIKIRETGSVTGSVSMETFAAAKPNVSLHNPANPQQHFTAEVDDKGNFTLKNVPPGDYIATAMSHTTPGARPTGRRTPPLTSRVTVKSGETSKVEIKKSVEVKKDVFPVAGSVLKEGKPFGEGSVELTPTKTDKSAPRNMMMGRGGKRGKIDPKSNFVIENMEAGEYIYSIRPAMKSKPTKSFFLQKSYSGTIQVKKDQKKLDINISGSTLEGLVRNKQGFPAKGVNIVVIPENVSVIKKQRLTRHTQANAEGRYSLDCIPAGLYTINVRSRNGVSSASKRNVKMSRKMHHLDLTLQGNSKVYGKVTINNSTKIRGASTVAVSCEDYSIPGYGTVTENGTYQITPPLPPGEYFIFSFKDGYAVSESKINLTANTEVNGTLVPGGKITLLLSSSSGKSIENRIVHVKSSDGKEVMRCRKPSQWTRSGGPWSKLLINPTDASGSTVIGGLRPGKYTINIEGSDKTTSGTVQPLEETIIKLDI